MLGIEFIFFIFEFFKFILEVTSGGALYSRIPFSFYVRVFSIIIFHLPKLVKEKFLEKMDPIISFLESGYDLKTCAIDKKAYHKYLS